MLHFLNVLATTILAMAYVPQIKTTYRIKSVEGVSVFFWYFISLSTAISLHNLLESGSAPFYVYLGQIINASVAFLLFTWINQKKLPLDKLVYVTLGHLVSMFVLLYWLPLPVTQFIATTAIILAYIDQIKHFVKTKTSLGTNPNLYYFFAFGLIVLVAIMFMTHVSPHVIATELINIVLLIVCGLLSQRYKKNLINV